MKKILWWILICFSVLTSCTTTKQIYITDSVRIPLLPVESICSPFESYQLMEGDFFAEAYTIADNEKIEINILASTGQTIGKALYDGRKATMESSFLGNNNIIASYVFLDFQLCWAPYSELSELLSSKGLILEEKKESGKTLRTVRQDGEVLYKIEITDDKTSVDNRYRGYHYSLENIF